MGVMPFQGPATFLKTPADKTRPWRFLGLPFDMASSFRPGSALGPNAIRAASMMLTDGEHPVFGVDPCLRVADMGDLALSSADLPKALAQIEAGVAQHLDQRLLIAGGNHLVTLGVLRAMAKRHGPVALIHMDAHCDTWPDHFGDPLGHGTFLRNAVDEGLIEPHASASIGLRSPVDPDTKRWFANKGGLSISAREALRMRSTGLSYAIRDRLRACGWRGKPVYLSFDIDALDPAFAPGTGTPEIGGLDSALALDIVEDLKGFNLVGADVVEVNPMLDHAQITALAAATILWTVAALPA
jgi:agmatinase